MQRYAEPFELLRRAMREHLADAHTILDESTQAAQDWRNAQPTFTQHLHAFDAYCKRSWSSANNAIQQAFGKLNTAVQRTVRELQHMLLSWRVWTLRLGIVWLWVRVYKWYIIGIPLAIVYLLFIALMLTFR